MRDNPAIRGMRFESTQVHLHTRFDPHLGPSTFVESMFLSPANAILVPAHRESPKDSPKPQVHAHVQTSRSKSRPRQEYLTAENQQMQHRYRVCLIIVRSHLQTGQAERRRRRPYRPTCQFSKPAYPHQSSHGHLTTTPSALADDENR